MKSDKKSVIWGVILLLAAAGLTILLFFPEVAPLASVALWKWPLAAILVFWLLNKLIFGKSLRAHFDIFLPLGLLFILFKSDIAAWLGKPAGFVNSWAILGIAVLLTIAVHLLFCGSGNDAVFTVNIQSDKAHDGDDDDNGDCGCRCRCSVGDTKDNIFTNSAVFCDLAEKTSFSVNNTMGATEIYFQNTDTGDATVPIRLTFNNRFGQTVIHAPSDWKVTPQVSNAFGEFRVRPNPETYTRELLLSGSNRFGETVVRP